MKKIVKGLVALLEKLAALNAKEPVVVRGGIAAVLNLLVVSGVVSVGLSSTLQTAILGTLTLILLVSTRQAVIPTIVSDILHTNAYLKGHVDAHDLIQAAHAFALSTEGQSAAAPVNDTDPATPAVSPPDGTVIK